MLPGMERGELLAVYHYAGREVEHWARHLHTDSNELIITLQGRRRVQMPGREIIADPGKVVCFPRRVVHEEWLEGEGPHEWIYMSFVGSFPGLQPVINDPLGRFAVLGRWILDRRLVADLPRNGAAQRQLMDLIFQVMLAEAQLPRMGDDLVQLTQLAEQVRGRLTEPLTLADLLRWSGMKATRFNRWFHAQVGQPPMVWVRNQRVERARELLRGSEFSLAEIAAQVGCHSSFQFSRLIQRATGLPPGALRRKLHSSVPSRRRPEATGKSQPQE